MLGRGSGEGAGITLKYPGEEMKVHRKSNEQKARQEPSGLTSGLGLALQFSLAFQRANLTETMYTARGYYLLTHPCIPFMNIFELQALFFLLICM